MPNPYEPPTEDEEARAPRPSSARASLTEGDEAVALRKLAIPMGIGIIFIILVNLVDTFFVGQLGTHPLAAMSYTFPVVSFVMSMTIGISIGATSAIARALGQGDRQVVRRLATHAILFAFLLVAIVSALGLLLHDPLFRALGADADTLPLVREYMVVWFASVIFLVAPMLANGAIRATGDSRTPMYIMMLAALSNLVLDPIFIFGLGPVPALGLRGAAIATAISRGVTFSATMWVLIVREQMIEFRFPRWPELRASWGQILSVGVPAAITNVLVPVAAGIVTALVSGHGHAAVAAFGVGSRIEGLVMLAPMAVGASLTPFVGQNWGAGQTDRVARGLQVSARFVVAWGIAGWLLLLPAGGLVARAFADDPEVIEPLRLFLFVVPIGYAGNGLVSVASSAFNAIDRALRSTALSVARSLVFAVPFAALGSAFFGLPGLFGGLTAAALLAAGLAMIWVRPLLRGEESPDVAAGEPATAPVGSPAVAPR